MKVLNKGIKFWKQESQERLQKKNSKIYLMFIKIIYLGDGANDPLIETDEEDQEITQNNESKALVTDSSRSDNYENGT